MEKWPLSGCSSELNVMEMSAVQYQDQPDIENEVRRLFRADNEAIDVKWDIIYEQDEDTKQDDSEASMPLPSKTSVVSGPQKSYATSVSEIGRQTLRDFVSMSHTLR